MIRTQLQMALDFKKDKRKPHERFSHRSNGQWFITSCGPGYCNTYKVVEFDADGLKLLELRERKL